MDLYQMSGEEPIVCVHHQLFAVCTVQEGTPGVSCVPSLSDIHVRVTWWRVTLPSRSQTIGILFWNVVFVCIVSFSIKIHS